ncbi:putative membrane protein [Candidatus Phaeomarinobacter ectocarpi]|uniref:Putative membrane protein n=1 Tax=Candidatus Phaeomarinibacter ectocarpi TaxID=1458461 RepID=X5MMC1_9HYPH|nr:DoxX family membrane protein [Candidatus Phaeomarinobacter ectocarpi]CDO60255.1 putative membrane protein [Candidatus Phaeomarinobacter ectocarpi]
MTVDGLSRAALPMGRVVLASLFVLGGLNKLVNYAATQVQMSEVGLWPALLPLVIALELGGGLVVALGRWGAVFAALALAAFTLATNIFFHDFWAMSGEMAALELSLFFKNVSIAGGLLFAAAGTHQLRRAA